MRSQSFFIDWSLLAPALVLVALSLTTLFSIDSGFFKRQLISLIFSLAAYFLFSRINIDFLKQLRVPIYVLSIILLAVTFVIGIESRGASRWIEIFGARLQFSETLKPLLSVAFASFLATRTEASKRTFFLSFALLIPLAFLIAKQPDLGSALVYVFVAIFVLFVAGFPLRWFVIAFTPIILFAPVLWTFLHEYQKQRIFTFLNPTSDPLGTSYNSIQAIIAVGSGAFLGKGWFEGTQSFLKFLPERHTDFIFATLAEGLGFLGAAGVIIVFAVLCYRIYLIFRESDDLFTKLFAACAFGFFLIQGFTNIGMNIGLVPVVGITLPFVSFGGNSLFANFIFLGILSSLHQSQKSKHVLEIR